MIRRQHERKCWPEYFQAVIERRKRFEFRKTEPGMEFKVGDNLWLNEWDPHAEKYTGRDALARITYVLPGPLFNVPEGWAILSIELKSGGAP